MPFEFASAGRIVFGEGAVREVPPAAAAMGRRALVITGSRGERAATLTAALEAAGVSCVPFAVLGEPTVESMRDGARFARGEACDLAIAMGGGSALDAGKALAALLTNTGDPLDYLEVVGRGQPLEHMPAPMIAVPTTAGTGSEVTRNAVLGSPEHRVKASLRSVHMLPRLAAVDPELTWDLPPEITASTGLDALTQLIEPYVSTRANAMTDLYCVEGMRCAASALPRAYAGGANREARRDMAWASLLGGLSLANAGLGAVHGFAAPIGGMFPSPHGAVCAAVLPHAIAVNVRALRERAPESAALRRYHEIGRILTGRPQAGADDAVEWISEICRRLAIPPLRTYGVRPEDFAVLVEKAAKASSMKANPIVLTPAELTEVIMRAA
jgi:alcohol dehydrogenase class IV